VGAGIKGRLQVIMETGLCKKLKNFKRDLYSVSGSSLLRSISHEDCKKICKQAAHDDFVGSTVSELEKILCSMKLDYDETHNNFHKKYWELFSYYLLKYEKKLA